MEFLVEYGLFLAKAITIVIAIGAIVVLIVSAGQRGGGRSKKGHIEVTRINEYYTALRDTLREAVLSDEQLKNYAKQEKKRLKKEQSEEKKAQKSASEQENTHKKRLYILNFNGDIKASATVNLKEEITTLLSLATDRDEVVVRLESGGGMVHSYGLAASQLARITKKNIPLTVCVDKVAASGGYMMACVADKILAAPFAVIGSIGVVAQLPNFHRLLKKNNVDFELLTAGEHKRTLTIFGENTDKGREKFLEELEDTHDLFKTYVHEHREQVDIGKVATGEVWFGRRAIEHKLIDDIQTSDEYITSYQDDADIFEIEYVHKKSLPEKLGLVAAQSVDRLLLVWWERLQSARFFS